MLVFIRPALVALGFAVFLAGSPALQAQTTTLKYKFRKGDSLTYVMQIISKRTLSGEKQFVGVESQEINLGWHVDSVDDKGTATVRLTFERVKFAFESPDFKGEVASDAKEEPKEERLKAASANVKAMSKVQGTFTLTAQGDIGKITVPASALEQIRAIPGWEKAPDGLVEQNLQAALKDSILGVPVEAIAKGKTWKHKVEGASPYGPFTGDMEYTFDGEVQRDGRPMAKFQVKPNIKIKIESDPKADFTIAIKGQQSNGAAYFDNGAGRLVEVTTLQVIEAQADDAKGKKILSQKTEVTNSFKLVKVSQ